MPKRTDIRKILVIGSGPITIGQGCEFDYSGTQACNSLREEGYQVVLVNSNPATIMTDPERATRTYIEPLTIPTIERIIEKELPQALLSTMGGQTALNLAVALAESGFLQKHGVELIGATLGSIKMAEDRELFRAKMREIGLPMPKSRIIADNDSVLQVLDDLSLPLVVRPSFTLGGTGGGIARTVGELVAICQSGLQASQIHTVLVEENVIGWKEIELEIVRDRLDNFIVVCAIENFDPMGVHTGDSIAVAPLQTLSDKEYQKLRDAARKIAIAVGLECGGANVQFAVNPRNGEFVVIEMNPRVSRSSALASKATGYPIAKVAAKLAVGLTLDEITNDIAGGTSACFEPSIDYVVTKIPRFDFDKFDGCNAQLSTEMKAVGEAMAIGSTYQESMQKALRSLELGVSGFAQVATRASNQRSEWLQRIATPTRHRVTDLWGAFAAGISLEELSECSGIDSWFLYQLQELWQAACLFQSAASLSSAGSNDEKMGHLQLSLLRQMKSFGFGDRQIAELLSRSWSILITEEDVWKKRLLTQLMPCYKAIDTCAAEFPTKVRYLYSSYFSQETEHQPGHCRKVIIIGSGPNRIGQGIEFDYCCVQASLALREAGVQSVMINCNPETVSTDYDVSDVLYFEPVTLEDVSNIAFAEKPDGIIIQLGGQTPLKLAAPLAARGFKILGTSCDSTDMAENRARFGELIASLSLRQPRGLAAHSIEEAMSFANSIGYPVLIRPSYVLGGKSMQVIHTCEQLANVLSPLFQSGAAEVVLVDEFLSDATEVDVDAVCDGKDTIIAGVLQHIEPAGVHSGDSSCVMPPQDLPLYIQEEIIGSTLAIARALPVIGFLNVQFAVKNDLVYVLEANPRASRTIPFISKATGVPWAKIATRVILGEKLANLAAELNHWPTDVVAVKSPIIPFARFDGARIRTGPEMRSTGEVMGIGRDFASAYAKAQLAAGRDLSQCKNVVVSATSSSQQAADECLQMLARSGLCAQLIAEHNDGAAGVMDSCSLSNLLKSESVDLVVSLSQIDELDDLQHRIRWAAVKLGIPLAMTLNEVAAIVETKTFFKKRLAGEKPAGAGWIKLHRCCLGKGS